MLCAGGPRGENQRGARPQNPPTQAKARQAMTPRRPGLIPAFLLALAAGPALAAAREEVVFAERSVEGQAASLRMVVSKDSATGQFRAKAGDDWQTLGTCDLPGPGTGRVGLMTGYAPKDSQHTSRFRRFRIVRVAD